ncbi:MAG TPA: glycosyltransferase [Thermoanaerobaculia bacterium]|nr:glycosyltransferase [Thermoanaerobaculia bacterium]
MPIALRTPHLLHVIPTFVPAGIEMRTVNLIAGFGGEFRHSILSMDGRTDAMDRLPADAPVRLLPTPEKAGSLRTAARLRQILRDEKPDLLLTYNWGAFDAILAARSLGFHRVLHHEDGFNAEEAQAFKRRRVLARRALLPWVPRLVVPSTRLRDIATQLWKVPADRIRLIRNGIRLDVFAPSTAGAELRRELGIPQEALVVGAVGHLRAEKNFVRLLDACAALGPDASPDRPVHVLIVGGGEELSRLEERAARPDLHGRVHLAGYRSDPQRLYRAMDVFAITSDTEQMPVCLLEAMASALPVVSTDVGDIKAVLPAEQERWLATLDGAATARALAGRIAELARDPETRRRLGALNRQRVEERFSFEAMLSTYREIYHEVLCLTDTPGLPAEEVVGLC